MRMRGIEETVAMRWKILVVAAETLLPGDVFLPNKG
jgi:hypothetical protein